MKTNETLPFTAHELTLLFLMARAVMNEPSLHKYFTLDTVNAKSELELEELKTKLDGFLDL